MTKIQVCSDDAAILECFAVMQQLRPHIERDDFLSLVKAQEAQGYRLVSMLEEGRVVAVAGFRLGSNLAWGKFLYVDDLVVDEACRSKGYGSTLIEWLSDYAKASSCVQFHLDSGLSREAAHRFYQREGMAKAGYHFMKQL